MNKKLTELCNKYNNAKTKESKKRWYTKIMEEEKKGDSDE